MEAPGRLHVLLGAPNDLGLPRLRRLLRLGIEYAEVLVTAAAARTTKESFMVAVDVTLRLLDHNTARQQVQYSSTGQKSTAIFRVPPSLVWSPRETTVNASLVEVVK